MKVFELTNLIKTRLETDFSSLKVEGEISNYRPSSSGHVYFTLKDEKSVISAVIFKNQASMLNFSPKDGQYVEVIGRLSVYAPRVIIRLYVPIYILREKVIFFNYWKRENSV
jgi:exodeoxyribonuclease VII large subunit